MTTEQFSGQATFKEVFVHDNLLVCLIIYIQFPKSMKQLIICIHIGAGMELANQQQCRQVFDGQSMALATPSNGRFHYSYKSHSSSDLTVKL